MTNQSLALKNIEFILLFQELQVVTLTAILAHSKPWIWDVVLPQPTTQQQQQDRHHYPKNFSISLESCLLLFFAYLQIKQQISSV